MTNPQSFREIVDESDVYVDVHKAIRRLTPAPRARRIEAAAAVAAAKKTTEHPVLIDIAEDQQGNTLQVGSLGAQSDSGSFEPGPRTAIFMKRRSSAGPDGRMDNHPVPVKASLEEMKRELRLGPANRAANPNNMKKESVFKIKQGLSVTHASVGSHRLPPRSASVAGEEVPRIKIDDERTPLISRNSADQSSKANGSRDQ